MTKETKMVVLGRICDKDTQYAVLVDQDQIKEVLTTIEHGKRVSVSGFSPDSATYYLWIFVSERVVELHTVIGEVVVSDLLHPPPSLPGRKTRQGAWILKNGNPTKLFDRLLKKYGGPTIKAVYGKSTS